MYWTDYLHDAGHAVQKGLSTGLHVLEGAVETYGALKGAYQLAGSLAPYVRALAPAAALL